jgi:citrate lyase beta subunit
MDAMATDLGQARSLLFAPGSDPRKLERALDAGADAVIADLEDAVAPDRKAAAREAVAAALGASPGPPLRLVRVNAAGTGLLDDDLAALTGVPLDGLVLPKATPEALDALGAGGLPVVALVETAEGLQRSAETAAHPRVAALMLGAVDLAVELRIEPRPDGLEILFARSKLVLDSAAAGLRGPIDVVHLDVRDTAGLEAEARLARSLGFRGKPCIHPAQVEAVNRAFTPSPDEVAHAREVVDAYDAAVAGGHGAVSVRGRMVDVPVVLRAREVLSAAGEPAGPSEP